MVVRSSALCSYFNLRSVFESEGYTVVTVYRSRFQKANPQPFVPGFKNEGLFFYWADEHPEFPVTLHLGFTLLGYHRQPGSCFFVPFDEPIVLLGVLLLGLLRGGILFDALADQFGNYLDFLVQAVDFGINCGTVIYKGSHGFAGLNNLLTGSHQLAVGFKEHLLNGICVQGWCLTLCLALELAVASPYHSAVSIR